MTTREVKASAVLMILVDQRHAALKEVIDLGAREAGLPPGVTLDVGRGVWLVPLPDPAP